MKKLFAFLIFSFWILSSFAQSANSSMPAVDKSPLDMSYFPVDYPVLKIKNKATEPALARVIYSRPQKAGRTIFGDLVEYGQVWRLGANEATEIEFYKDVKISGKKIAKGRYTLYAIPYPDKWTMIVNKDTDTWGAFKYDAKKDILRTDIDVQKTAAITEAMAMTFMPDTTAKGKPVKNFNLIIAWDDVKITLPVSL